MIVTPESIRDVLKQKTHGYFESIAEKDNSTNHFGMASLVFKEGFCGSESVPTSGSLYHIPIDLSCFFSNHNGFGRKRNDTLRDKLKIRT